MATGVLDELYTTKALTTAKCRVRCEDDHVFTIENEGGWHVYTG